MINALPNDRPARARVPRLLPAIVVPCWLALVWTNLYFFGYAGMDSWCYAAPALAAKAPFQLTMPFLGTFEGSDRAWGLHWPGGPLLTSAFAPFLPHNPGVFVSIYIFYWALLAAATTALVWRLTRSSWMAFVGFLFVAGDRLCFSDTWLQRYELLDAALAICALLALCGDENQRPRLRLTVIGVTLFLLPVMHPIFMSLSIGWLVLLAIRTWALQRPWKQFIVASVATAAGWAAFFGYYLSRPWLFAIFRNHARTNMLDARAISPPGLGMFINRLMHIGDPQKTGTVVFVTGLGFGVCLLIGLWRSRATWRAYVAREELPLFLFFTLAGSVFLAQFNYTDCYWAPAWPFAVALTCLLATRVMDAGPGRPRLCWAALALVLAVHWLYLPARTYAWSKLGFVNLRAKVRDFGDSLPQGGQLFLPEVFWDSYADGRRPIYMNSVPGRVGDIEEKKYADFITPMIRKGDVLVTDTQQTHQTLIDPHQPGWKQIGTCTLIYGGRSAGLRHGFDLPA